MHIHSVQGFKCEHMLTNTHTSAHRADIHLSYVLPLYSNHCLIGVTAVCPLYPLMWWFVSRTYANDVHSHIANDYFSFFFSTQGITVDACALPSHQKYIDVYESVSCKLKQSTT